MLFHNPATTNDFIAAVEDRCLPGRDRALRLVEFYASTSVAQRSNRCRRRSVTITHAYVGLNSFALVVEGNPVHARGHELIAQQFFLFADHNAVSVRIDSDNVERLRISDANAASLSDCIMMNAGVRADHRAFRVDDFTRAWQAISLSFRGEIAVDESGIITVGNETDFL